MSSLLNVNLYWTLWITSSRLREREGHKQYLKINKTSQLLVRLLVFLDRSCLFTCGLSPYERVESARTRAAPDIGPCTALVLFILLLVCAWEAYSSLQTGYFLFRRDCISISEPQYSLKQNYIKRSITEDCIKKRIYTKKHYCRVKWGDVWKHLVFQYE